MRVSPYGNTYKNEKINNMRIEQNETATFSFHGPAVNDGRMEIRDFVEAARGFTEMLEIASKQNGTPISAVKIKNIEQGSFLASLAIEFDTTFIETLRDFFSSENGTALTNLATITSTIGSAIAVFRKFKTHKPDKIENHGTTTTVYDSQNTQIFNGPTNIYNVAIDPRFASALEAFATPLKNTRVDKAKLFPSDPKTTVELNRNIFKYLEDTPDYRIEEHELDLKILRVAFDHASWRFRAYPNQGPEYEFTAEILDDQFLDQANYTSWGSNDYIHATVKTIIPLQPGKHRRFQILKVNDVTHQPTLEVFNYDPPNTQH